MRILILAAFLFIYAGISAQLPSYVPTNSLIAFWPFSGNANDQSGNGHNGTVSGATLSTDRFNASNNAYSFNGTSDNIMVPDAPTLSNYTDMSISAWINANTFTGVRGIVCKWYQEWDCGNLADTYEAAMSGMNVQFATNNNNLSAYITPPSLTSADLNAWKHLVFIHRAATGGSIYINAVLAATDPASGTICPSTNPLYMGADYDGNIFVLHRFFSGKLDDIGLWNRALNLCEIKTLYHASTGSFAVSSSNATVCAGKSVTLSTSGASSCTWSPAGSTGTVLVANLQGNVNYTVTGTNTLTGCSTTVNFNQVVSKCTGIDDWSMGEVVNLFPNPGNGLIKVEGLPKDCEVIVYNNIAQVVYECKIDGALDLRQLPCGVYTIRLQDASGSCVKRFLKTD